MFVHVVLTGVGVLFLYIQSTVYMHYRQHLHNLMQEAKRERPYEMHYILQMSCIYYDQFMSLHTANKHTRSIFERARLMILDDEQFPD